MGGRSYWGAVGVKYWAGGISFGTGSGLLMNGTSLDVGMDILGGPGTGNSFGIGGVIGLGVRLGFCGTHPPCDGGGGLGFGLSIGFGIGFGGVHPLCGCGGLGAGLNIGLGIRLNLWTWTCGAHPPCAGGGGLGAGLNIGFGIGLGFCGAHPLCGS